MKTLIIGAGEIGKSLYNVFKEQYETTIRDIEDPEIEPNKVDIMHVTIPYSTLFTEIVKEYQEKYNPKYTVVHSTVPAGICRELGVIHSPVVGLHPHLAESLKVFTKFLSGPQASEVAQYFRRAGIKVYLTDKQDSTELMKALSTTYYGMMIEFTKEVKRLCDEKEVPFELWTIWTDNYNKGYTKLGYPEYVRPNLVPIMTKVGGHCILPNLKFIDSKISQYITERNED